MAKRNLILGWLYDRSWEEIRAFVVSAKRAKMDADVVILAWHNEAEAWEKARGYGAEVVAVPKDYVPSDVNLGELTHFISRRYCFYDWYMRQHPEYERVLLTGIRDVIIQTDPFVYDPGDALCCFLESILLRESAWNRMWLHDGFNQQELERIHDNPVSCAEIVYGNHKRVLEYVELMLPHICSPGLKVRVIDQAVHNYLLWNGLLGEVRTFRPGKGIVFTMGYHYDGRGQSIWMNVADQVFNDDGTVAPVIHQYDRFEIETALRARYS